MLRKKEFTIAFSGMMLLSVFSLYYSIEIQNWYGWHDYRIISGNWMTMLHWTNRGWQIFMYLFCFVAVLPYSLSYPAELEAGCLPILVTRSDRTCYCLSKVVVCFIGSSSIILIPLLLNWCFSQMAFSSMPNLPGIEYKLKNYSNLIDGSVSVVSYKHPTLQMAALFVNRPNMYVLLHVVLLSLFSGFWGVVLLFFSFWARRYRALVFLPLFLFVRLSSAAAGYAIETGLNDAAFSYSSVSFMDYFSVGSNNGLNPYYLIILLLIMFIFCFITYLYILKTDWLMLGETHRTTRGKNGKWNIH